MENPRAFQLSIFVIVFVASHVLYCYGSTESDANSVEIKLYPASLSDWTSSIESTFKTTVADQTTTYCGANPSTCGLDNGNTFSSADVTVHSKTESSRSLKLSVYVSYPTGSNVTSGGSTTEQVPLAALKAILKAARDTVKTDIDMYITYIASDYYGVPVESKANGIIIPIAAVTVVAVGISAVVMVYIQESQEKKERTNARLAKKRALKAVPNYNIPEIPNNSEPNASELPVDVHYGDHNHSGNSQALNNNHDKKKRSQTSTTAATAQQPSVNHFHHNGNASSTLPPLSGNSNITTVTTTTVLSTDNSEEYDQQEQTQQWELRQHHNQQQQPVQQLSFDEALEDARRKRKKEKKREKKRLLIQQRQQQLLQEQQEGFELHDNQGFDTSAMTISENSAATPRDNIPTFTVQRRGDVSV